MRGNPRTALRTVPENRPHTGTHPHIREAVEYAADHSRAYCDHHRKAHHRDALDNGLPTPQGDPRITEIACAACALLLHHQEK